MSSTDKVPGEAQEFNRDATLNSTRLAAFSPVTARNTLDVSFVGVGESEVMIVMTVMTTSSTYCYFSIPYFEINSRLISSPKKYFFVISVITDLSTLHTYNFSENRPFPFPSLLDSTFSAHMTRISKLYQRQFYAPISRSPFSNRRSTTTLTQGTFCQDAKK